MLANQRTFAASFAIPLVAAVALSASATAKAELRDATAGRQYAMPAASLSSGGESYPNGSFAVLGQALSGTMTDGQFTLEVGIVPVMLALTTSTSCSSSSSPTGDPITPDQGNGTKNRYASFSAGDAGQQQAIQVTFASMPGYEYAQGRTAWVQAPFEVTEASCCNGPTPPPTYWAAELGCIPHYTDWTVFGTVDLYDDAIVPGCAFEFRVIDTTCNIADPGGYSTPLMVNMSATGDAVGDCGVTPCTPPQGVIDFVDISGLVDKFRNLPAAPRKARADLINSDITQALPDKKIDFVDISYCVEAFRGSAAALPGPPATDPCGP